MVHWFLQFAGKWPCASWVTGGSLKHVGRSSPASPLHKHGKYHPDTENTKTRCHGGFTNNKMEITSWFKWKKLNLQAIHVYLGSGLVLLWWPVEAWNAWGAHPLLPLCNKNGSTALIQRIQNMVSQRIYTRKDAVHHGLKGINLTFRRSIPTWIVALRFFGDWWKPATGGGLISWFTFPVGRTPWYNRI
jgi:hypothetical protein